jgi:phage baseplate assembly protein W
MQLEYSYPYQIDKNGRTAKSSEDKHIRQMIEQVLFTTPGERVNRPTFGSGINQLVFAPLNDELVTATQLLVQGALQQWLGDLISIESVQITSQESTLQIDVRYTIKRTQQTQIAQFKREV